MGGEVFCSCAAILSCTLWGALGLLFHKVLAHLLSSAGFLLQEFRKYFFTVLAIFFYSCNCSCFPRSLNMCDWSSQLWFLEDIPSNKREGFQKVSSLIPDFQLESRLIHFLHVEALHSHGDFWPLQSPLAIQNQLKRGELTISIPFVSDPSILLYHFSCNWGTKSLQNSQTVLVAAAHQEWIQQ